MAIRIAVLLTVFNRKEVTINGLRFLYNAVNQLPANKYEFDIYMTDDGCTDGTSKVVRDQFPNVNIIQGDGSLYWCGGMRLAWQKAIESNIKYDYFLWYNDDAELYDDALKTMFLTLTGNEDNVVISGAFQDKDGRVSYGGKDKNWQWVVPCEKKEIYYMNGNFVLIPYKVFQQLGMIDELFIHGYGDWDYGFRAKACGFNILLSIKYVGVTERHDNDLDSYANASISFKKRWQLLHNVKNSPKTEFIFKYRHFGLINAVVRYLAKYLYTFFPIIFLLKNKKLKSGK